jgi:hypothetical protein
MKSYVFGGQRHRYLCLNEAVCAQLAIRAGISVPQPAVVELESSQLEAIAAGAQATDRFAFASELIEDAEPLSPSVAAAADRGQLAGIAVLDALVRNSDEKPEHILARLEDEEWDVLPIDHGNTLAVSDTLSSFRADEPAAPTLPLIAAQISWTNVEPWLDRFAGIERSEFQAMVDGLPAPWVVEPDAAPTLADVLHERVRLLPDLLKKNLHD